MQPVSGPGVTLASNDCRVADKRHKLVYRQFCSKARGRCLGV